MEGLSSLEYRGYDSVGISIIDPSGNPRVHKASGRLSRLRAILSGDMPNGTAGIGHTRWATHGGPTDSNAHPHVDCLNQTTVVHNGIVENYLDLKRELVDRGHSFTSQTDTECIPHLIESYFQEGCSLEEAVRRTASRLLGANAVVVASRLEPSKIVAFRLGNAGGVVVGYGDGEMLLGSDLPALLPHTRRVVYLASGEVATLTQDMARYSTLDGAPVEKPISSVPYGPMSASKGEHKHYMLKEIREQPSAVLDTLMGRVNVDAPGVDLEEYPFSQEETDGFNRVVFIGMGTSLHSAMVGRIWMESLAGIPAEVDNSSEFRYRDSVIDGRTLVVSISQSGETADTLAAMEAAARKGARQITLVNYDRTQTTRIADCSILIRAGLEVSVAASKTFTCSLTALCLLAVYLGIRRGNLERDRVGEIIRELAQLPNMLGGLLEDESQYGDLARRYAKYSHFLYLGRGVNYPLAAEGALKLKEISYIHAEGYPAGEMKHGPISLIDENMPVVALTPRDGLYDKMLSNVNEVRARGGSVIAVASEGDDMSSSADDVIYVPKASPIASPMLMAAPMQLLAYHIAVKRGCDVDQPRNLAKSVTVE